MLTDALRYPFRGSHARDIWAVLVGSGLGAALLGRFAVGLYPAVLWLLPAVLVLVPVSAGLGVCRAVVATSIAGNDEVPQTGSLSAFVTPGATTVGLSLVYLLVPFLAMLVTVAGAGSLSPDAVAGSGGLVVTAGSTAVVVLVLLVSYLYPVAVARLADGDGLFGSLDPRPVAYVLRDSTYLLTWGVVVTAGGIALTGFLVFLTGSNVVGLAAGVAAVYLSLVASRLLGVGYASARR
ncbi:DUF4013 domain-containing protein [Haloarchaeobius sp. DFWS5]|uniref:DUF4013 domain-containing protein n=1 Tax=Haloarchaeobius sp. DFWS5 TaxID=3446114 RepID=UPI003EBC93E3